VNYMNRRRKILIAIGVTFIVAVAIPVIRHYQLRFAVESYIAELKAKGEPMDLAQVIPPPVPPEQNSAAVFLKAASLMDTNWNVLWSNPPPAMRPVTPGKAMIGWQQPDIRGYDATNSWKDIETALAKESEGLNLLYQIADHPTLDFNLNYYGGVDKISMSHLAPLRRATQRLSAAAIDDLHCGDTASAVKNIRAMIALVKGETDERLIISQLVRIAIASMGASVTWEILQDADVSDDDLAQLQRDWQSLEFTSPLEGAIMFGRVGQLQEVKQIRRSSKKFDELWGYFYAPNASPNRNKDLFSSQKRRSLFLRKWDELRWRWFWSYQDEKSSLQAFQVVIDATRMAETNKAFQSVESFTVVGLKPWQNSSNGLRNVFSQSAFGLDAALRRAVRIETARNVVVTAIALKRYELQHHQLPATLTELTPDLLKSVPTDYMDGQPLRYHRNADGTFLLYSIGEDGVDDGGDPKPSPDHSQSSYWWQFGRDWVWPQPATAEEIQAYYASKAKK